MKFYKVTEDEGVMPTYWTKKADAHFQAKALQPRDPVLIELVEVEINHDVIAHLLSGDGCGEKVQQTWRLSPRGGMVECNPEDY